MPFYKDNVSKGALLARQNLERQHEKLRKHGMVCVECGLKKKYTDFPINRRSKRVTLGKPCLKCDPILSNNYQRADADDRMLYRVCPACHKQRNPTNFHATGLCQVCFKEQQTLVEGLCKTCPVCQVQREISDYDGKSYCKKCASFLAVHTCSLCKKGFQGPEMVSNDTCVYCAFARGSEQDLVVLRALVRSDKLSAIKLREFIDSLPRS